MVSLWLNHDFATEGLSGFSVGGGVRYIGATWGASLNTIKLSPYTLFDLRVGYAIGQATLSVNVTNVFDRTYLTSYDGSNNFVYYGEPRKVNASLSYRF